MYLEQQVQGSSRTQSPSSVHAPDTHTRFDPAAAAATRAARQRSTDMRARLLGALHRAAAGPSRKIQGKAGDLPCSWKIRYVP